MDDFSKAKRLNDAYPFTTARGVHVFLKNRDRLRESTYLHGGVEALILLIDFEALEKVTPLTAKQRYMLHLYYEQGYTKPEIAEIMGLTHQTVSEHTRAAVEKLAKTYCALIGGEENGD
jgi:DNA-directed RNA polymerase specialized sigma24 family protein